MPLIEGRKVGGGGKGACVGGLKPRQRSRPPWTGWAAEGGASNANWYEPTPRVCAGHSDRSVAATAEERTETGLWVRALLGSRAV